MKFHVIDKQTGREPDTYEIACKEEWAKSLMYPDIEGWFIGEDGKTLLLVDECGNWEYADTDRFQVVWEVTNANK